MHLEQLLKIEKNSKVSYMYGRWNYNVDSQAFPNLEFLKQCLFLILWYKALDLGMFTVFYVNLYQTQGRYVIDHTYKLATALGDTLVQGSRPWYAYYFFM